MDLPTFNTEGSGPQGAGALPPEEFMASMNASDEAIVRGAQRPEDAPAAAAAIQAAVGEMIAGHAELNGQQTAQIPQAPAASAPAPQTAQAPRQPAVTGIEDDRASKIATILAKYPDMEHLADAYLHTDQARTSAQMDLGVIRRELPEIIRSEVANALSSFNREPGHAPQPQAAAPAAPEAQAPDFFADPNGWFQHQARQVIAPIVAENLAAAERIRQEERRAERFEEMRQQNETEIKQYWPVMEQILEEDRPIYQNLPREVGIPHLLKRAKERVQQVGMFQDFRTLAGGQPAGQAPGNGNANPYNTVLNPNPGPGASAMPSGMAGRTAGPGGPSTDWSNTPNMKRLWQSQDGTSKEDRAVMAVLREREYGEHIKVV